VLTIQGSRRAQRGMSMVEIFITLAIVGLVLGFAGPSAMTWIQNTQIRNAAESVLNGAQLARLEALKRNVAVSFEMTDPNSTAWRVCLYDVIGNACLAGPLIAEKGATEGGQNARIGADLNIGDTSASLPPGANLPGSITFDPFGRLAATAPVNLRRVDVRNQTLSAAEERRLVVTVSMGGQLRLCDPRLVFANNPRGCQ
jgi:type IV fimbrial biogenesis protein FimT